MEPKEIDRASWVVESEYDLFEPKVVAEFPLEKGTTFAKQGARVEILNTNGRQSVQRRMEDRDDSE